MEWKGLFTKIHWPQAGFLAGSYLVLCGLLIGAVKGIPTHTGSPVAVQALGAWQTVAFLAVAVIVGAMIIRKVKARVAWELVLGVTLFLGVWFYAWAVFSGEVGLVIAAIVTLLQAWIRRVWIHDVFILLGAAGVALNFAFLLPVNMILILFFVLAIYDTFLARSGSPMVRFAASLVHRGIVPGLIIPGRVREMTRETREVIATSESVFLGAGDLILPSVLVVLAAASGTLPAVVVTLGCVLAAAWLGSRGATAPFPALLPFAVTVGLPFLVMKFFHIV